MAVDELIIKLSARFPDLHFVPSQQFSWSSETNEIFYKTGVSGRRAVWALLHESGHALLGHTSYQADFELIRLEIAAWERAKALAKEMNIVIDKDHIEDCLDTYRDWLHKRSICPTCATQCLQQGDFVHYRCFNCRTVWRVTASRFCRAYRSTKGITQPSQIFV